MKRPAQPIAIDTPTIVRILVLITVFVGCIWLVSHLRHELVWIGVAFFLAVALDPAVNTIAKVLHGGRLLATGIVFIAFLLVLAFLGASLVPPLVSQTTALANQLPHFLQQAQNGNTSLAHFVQHYNLVERARDAQTKIINSFGSSSGTAFGVIKSLLTDLTAVVTTLVLTFFMLLEGPRWVTLGWRYVPIAEHSHYHRLSTKMYKIVAGYVTGNLIIAALVAVMTAILLAVLQVPYSIPLGLFSGLCTIIPIIGGLMGLIACGGVAIFTSTSAAIILAVYFLIYFFLDGHVLRPLVYGRTIEMSSLRVIISIVLGTALGGIIGALVSIPVVACIGVLLSDMVGGEPTAVAKVPTKSVGR